MSFGAWNNNAELIADVAKLGYLGGDEALVLDPTYGLGNMWTIYRPNYLFACDLDPAKSPSGKSVDFRDMPFASESFDAVVFDPPYKFAGKAKHIEQDHRYGVESHLRWQDRLQMILDGARECSRVTKRGGHLLVKCQDQVVSGKVVWQTLHLTEDLADNGLRLKDRFDLVGYRPQPPGRTQVHARRNTSQLLVFEKLESSRRGGLRAVDPAA